MYTYKIPNDKNHEGEMKEKKRGGSQHSNPLVAHFCLGFIINKRTNREENIRYI